MDIDKESCCPMDTTPSTVTLSHDEVPVTMNPTSNSGGVDEAIQEMTARLSYLSFYSGSYNEGSFVKKARRDEKRAKKRQISCSNGKESVECFRLMSAADDSPRMQITIGNLTYNALMDTGATQCFIGQQMLAAIGWFAGVYPRSSENNGCVCCRDKYTNQSDRDEVCSLNIGHNFMRRVGLNLHTEEGYFSCTRAPGVHIPYVPYEVGFREHSLKLLHVFNNTAILANLDWDERLVAGSDCTAEQRLMLKDMLTSVRNVFSENPGCSLTHTHSIKLKEGAKIPRHPFRTFNPAKKAIMIKLVEELEALGLIERATGNYISYPIIVSKPDGTYRILNCVADALSRASLPDEETPIDDYVESKEVTKYCPEWDSNKSCLKRIKAHSSYLCNCDVQFRHPDDPVVSASAKPIVSSGEGEGSIDSNDKPVATLYSALTDLLDEVPPTRKEIIAAQKKDPFCMLINDMCDYAEGGDEYSIIVKFHPTFEEELNDSGAGFKAFIPSSLIQRIIFACHGHPLSGQAGISKTLARAMQLYVWPKMRKDVRKYVRGCLHCQQYKPPNKRLRAAPYQPQSMAYPWETICIDLMGPKPTAYGQKKWILVIIYQCTKYIELFPLATASSAIIVQKINEVACRWGHPSKIISDNGKQFVGTIFREFCKSRNIKMSPTSTYNPSANPTERANRDLKTMLAIFTDIHSRWPRFLNEFAFVSRTNISEALGYSPMYLKAGRLTPLPFDPRLLKHAMPFDVNNPEKYVKELMGILHRAHRDMYRMIQRNYEKHDRIHCGKFIICEFQLDNLVMKRTHILSNADKVVTSGLAEKRDGPWQITKVHGGGSYELTKLENGAVEKSVNIKDLTPYNPSYPVEIWSSDQTSASHDPQLTPEWMTKEVPKLVYDEFFVANPNVRTLPNEENGQVTITPPGDKPRGCHHRVHRRRDVRKSGIPPPPRPPSRKPRTRFRKPNRKYIDGFVN
uniref:RNA-directed DNA polymerase n=1 Tax=Strigamia maritima TaxID=126957 RepID=T1IZB8_STRMM